MKLALALLFALTTMTHAADLAAIPLKDIDGKDTSLAAHKGKVLLAVNVASACGYTSQYEGLEALYRKFKDRGLVVLGFPCNDFGAQEPGSEAEIKQFCSSRFSVTFPMFAKLHVKGPEQHPLYAALTAGGAPVKWNFGKFLVGKDGKVIARYGSDTEPDDEKLLAAIEAAL
ncbi:MAG: glutathione peroxidase [Chthoniobacteraceae bacterium]